MFGVPGTESFFFLLTHSSFDDITLGERTLRWLIYCPFYPSFTLKGTKNRASEMAANASMCIRVLRGNEPMIKF